MARENPEYTFDNPPLESAEINAQLVKALEKAQVPVSAAPHALRDLAVVGALLTDEHLVRTPDLTMLVTACKTLASGGMPIHPAPSLRVFNLLAPVKSDFLQTEFNSSAGSASANSLDLAVVCFVPNFSPYTDSVRRLHPEQLHMPTQRTEFYQDYTKYRQERLTAVSLYHDCGISWGVAAHEHGAKFVTTYGGAQDEIHSDHFVDSRHYDMLISTREDFNKGGIGCSIGSYGFVIHKDHVQTAAKHANPETLIGKRLNIACQRHIII